MELVEVPNLPLRHAATVTSLPLAIIEGRQLMCSLCDLSLSVRRANGRQIVMVGFDQITARHGWFIGHEDFPATCTKCLRGCSQH